MTSKSLYPSYPPDLNEAQRDFLKKEISEWALAHGLAIRSLQSWTDVDPQGILAVTAPVTIFPSLLPRSCFEQACSIQRAYNHLYAHVASDEAWLTEVVKELIPIDDFMANLWKVHLAVKEEGYAQDLALGLFRSDYMVHVDTKTGSPNPSVRQVEFNTIASSFGGLSAKTAGLHGHLRKKRAFPESSQSVLRQDSLVPSPTLERLSAGLLAAHRAYGAPLEASLTCILFITQPKERNVFDQKHLEYAITVQTDIPVIRLAFSDVLRYTRVAQKRALLYTPPSFPSQTYEVTTIYLRSGYAPSEYENVDFDAWGARLQLERSRAIKCPTVLTQLAGTKKVQQILATPHSPHVERYLPFEDLAQRVKNTFAPMYPLDAESEAGKEGRRLATDPETAKHFVLKPQREGGGNNIYRSAIPAYLKSIPENSWAAYVLMEMIEPPPQRNVILRNGEVQAGSVICELGVFGACLWRQGAQMPQHDLSLRSEYLASAETGKPGILHNEEAGYLLRTKGDQSEEGGVAAGFGAIDSLCLVDI